MLLSGITIAVLTVSDGVASGSRKDESGPALCQRLKSLGASVVTYEVVPDEMKRIRERLLYFSDHLKASLVLTTGGTGLGPRDVTPEATRAVLSKEACGISELMRAQGRNLSPRAALSRGVCGVRGRSLILNLPGSPKGALESWSFVEALIPHALLMVAGGGHEKS